MEWDCPEETSQPKGDGQLATALSDTSPCILDLNVGRCQHGQWSALWSLVGNTGLRTQTTERQPPAVPGTSTMLSPITTLLSGEGLSLWGNT